MNEAIFLQTITVTDPDSGGLVELCVFKHDNGGMFAIDSSYIDQCFDDDSPVIINDPFEECDENRFATVKLIGT